MKLLSLAILGCVLALTVARAKNGGRANNRSRSPSSAAEASIDPSLSQEVDSVPEVLSSAAESDKVPSPVAPDTADVESVPVKHSIIAQSAEIQLPKTTTGPAARSNPKIPATHSLVKTKEAPKLPKVTPKSVLDIPSIAPSPKKYLDFDAIANNNVTKKTSSIPLRIAMQRYNLPLARSRYNTRP